MSETRLETSTCLQASKDENKSRSRINTKSSQIMPKISNVEMLTNIKNNPYGLFLVTPELMN